MKIMIIGAGGREHALAWKFAQDARVSHIYVAPGNAGTASMQNVSNIALSHVPDLLDFAKRHEVSLTFVGSEALLVEGIVDAFQAAGLKIFGPDARAAQLEGSKCFAKDFMQKYGVKTAKYRSFNAIEPALMYLQTHPYPAVVKASGLAAGKGVVICQNYAEAESAVRAMMEARRFGDAGTEVVIEEFLDGFECSILSFCDSRSIVPLLSAKDHKTIGENNTGENTGGMGVVAPHPRIDEAHLSAFTRDILTPTLKGIQAEGMDFAGVIFFGLMINERGVFLIEYNMRLGDPETQAILPLMENDLLDPIEAALERRLQTDAFHWKNAHACCVVAASAGYPGEYRTRLPIHNLEQARFYAQVFIAGATLDKGQYYTQGGRVLNCVGISESAEEARRKAYDAVAQVRFDGITYRRDIGVS
ncbi:MAG: phosphoribosylamine--glycine ligase [Cardiobacteriaceae bacterium]|nr:phosphoribosylamine--glycine ligase [Cardiobacteriaceae bacterium]